MKQYIYINYFRDSDPKRRAEYLYCISRNQSLAFVDKIFVFLENSEHKNDIVDQSKLEFINLDRRLEFRDCIDHAEKNLEPNSVIIILNLDIFLEDSPAWATIDKNFFDVGHSEKAMVVKRHNLDHNMIASIETTAWTNGVFCDGWILQTPFNPDFVKEDLNFCVGGAPQCDNVMMFLMNKYYHTFSWGSKYKIFHYDVCRKNAQTKMITNNKTDWRPSKRKAEHSCIPAYQDWTSLLQTEKRPSVVQVNYAASKSSSANMSLRFEDQSEIEFNQIRLEHLASLGLDINNRTVLEVGAGIGLHTPFFIDRGCRVNITDGNPLNVSKIKIKFTNSTVRLLDLEINRSFAHLGKFDLIYCYGMLHHVSNPESSLKRLAEVCNNQILLELAVLDHKTECVIDVNDPSGNTQSTSGTGSRASRLWILNKLKQYFGYGYITATQPNDPVFPVDWNKKTVYNNARAVFVGSKVPLNNPLLLDQIPQQQTRYQKGN